MVQSQAKQLDVLWIPHSNLQNPLRPPSFLKACKFLGSCQSMLYSHGVVEFAQVGLRTERRRKWIYELAHMALLRLANSHALSLSVRQPNDRPPPNILRSGIGASIYVEALVSVIPNAPTPATLQYVQCEGFHTYI